MTLVRLINSSNKSHLIITLLNSHELKKKITKTVQIISILPLSISKIKYINKTINEFKPKLFQGWMYHGDFLSSILGLIYNKPIIWNIRHGEMSLKYSSKPTLILRSFLAIISHFVPNKIISCSRKGVLIHKRIGYTNDKFKVIHNGINLKPTIRNKIPIKNKEIIIASIGRDNRQKGRTYYIDIIKELSKDYNVKSLIIGKGVTESKEIKEALNNAKINISLHESIDNIENILCTIDILLLTSSYGEGCPNILIEALQYGVLSFSTEVGDARYILNNDKFIIPFRNPKCACTKIERIINESKNSTLLMEEIKSRAISLFSEEKMYSDYHNLWESI